MADLPNRTDFEERFAARMSRLSSRHRRELQHLLGVPPDISRVPDSFWERVQRETEEEAAALMLLIMLASSRVTLSSIPESSRIDVDRAADRIVSQAAEASARRAAVLAESYTERSREMLGLAGQRWADAEPGAITGAEIAEDTTSIFGPARSESVAITETTQAASIGGELAIEATVGKSDGDTWFTAQDNRVCPICGPLHGASRERWSRFFPSGPPAHPRCRCWIQYAIEAANESPRLQPVLSGS
jgi:hypothetical protein